MCKSIKDGGARCAYHVGENASAALVTYVASTTGLGGQASREAFDDLVAEFQGAPDPTRVQVDEFLEQQCFRARHEPTLTEKRRNSILRRLQDAIGKATPSGATFAAWKNLVAESWSRVRRKAAAAFVVGALSFSLGACGNTTTEASPESVATQTSASAPADPSPSAAAGEPALSSESWTVKGVKVEERVIGLKGEKAAQEVQALAEHVAKEYGFNEQSIKYVGKDGKAESSKWMLAARKDMTPVSAADWTNTVNTYFREKKDQGTPAWGDMMSFTTYGLYENAEMLPADTSEPLMFDMTINKMEIDLSDDGRVWVTMNTSAKFNFTNEGKPAMTRMDRKQDIWFKQVDGQWKVDGWTGKITATVLS